MTSRESEEAALRLDVGLCITDHNEIRGSLELYERGRVTTIPAIEVGSSERLDFLIYFRDADDLVDYFRRHVEPYKRKRFYAVIDRSFELLLPAAVEYDAFVSLAHPFAPVWKNVGYDARRYERLRAYWMCIGAIEVANGEMGAAANRQALDFCQRESMPATGGSDAHLVSRIGSVTTSLPEAARESPFDYLPGLPLMVDATRAKLRHRVSTAYQVGASHTRLFLSAQVQSRWLQAPRVAGLAGEAGNVVALRDGAGRDGGREAGPEADVLRKAA